MEEQIRREQRVKAQHVQALQDQIRALLARIVAIEARLTAHGI